MRYSFTIKERKLGREKSLGQAILADRLIEIDPRLDRDEYIKTLIHEALHILAPFLDEDHTEDWCKQIGHALIDKMEDRGYLK